MPTPTGSRPGGTEANRSAYVDRLTRDLLALKARVSADDTDSERFKDARAHESLVLASRLFDFLAGWARDHVVGRTISAIPSAPYAPGTSGEQELGTGRPWDDPDLEAKGAAYDYADPELNQRIVAEFARVASRVFGWPLGSDLSEAFRALAFGEVTDLVRPQKSYLKGRAYRLWRLRLEAVELAAFRHGTGMLKEDALMEVSAGFGLGSPPEIEGWKTVERWQSELPKRFNPHMVRDAIGAAYVGGQWHTELSGRLNLDEWDREHLCYLDNSYGEAALKAAGHLFRTLQPRMRSKR